MQISRRSTEPINATLTARKRLGQSRWMVLAHAHSGATYECTDAAAWGAIRLRFPDADLAEVRKAIVYLQLAGLLVIGTRIDTWQLTLTKAGVDVVDRTGECPAGIERPMEGD